MSAKQSRLNAEIEELTDNGSAVSGCCGGPAPENDDACCVKDAEAKAAGEDGCGCRTSEI